jgi:hypothetical protein
LKSVLALKLVTVLKRKVRALEVVPRLMSLLLALPNQLRGGTFLKDNPLVAEYLAFLVRFKITLALPQVLFRFYQALAALTPA